jgi:hypothetical protein
MEEAFDMDFDMWEVTCGLLRPNVPHLHLGLDVKFNFVNLKGKVKK